MEIGESLVSAYFKYVEGQRLVAHNVPFDQGQGEIDLIIIDPLKQQAIFCEVTTHLDGMLYEDNATTVAKVREKLQRCEAFAKRQFPNWRHEYQVWSPRVGPKLRGMLQALQLELDARGLSVVMVFNETYSVKVARLKEIAAGKTTQTDEPAFRMLQILTHMK